METAYTQLGYENRHEYLLAMAEDFGLQLGTVAVLADLLGPSEDFDGLVSALKDIEGREDL